MLIAVVGATATGKSDLAVSLACALDGEVINADSMQLYRGMDIGTAKLSLAERQGIPHHLLDIWDVTETASVAEYQGNAGRVIDDIGARGKVPVLAGGSGLYIRAALGDLDFPGTDERGQGAPGGRARLGRPRVPLRAPGRERPGGRGGHPALERPPDRARARGDRTVRPPVQRHAARL